jgi:hypothetical protein
MILKGAPGKLRSIATKVMIQVAAKLGASNGNPEMEKSSSLFLPLFDNHPTLSAVYDKTFKWCNNRKAELDKDPINTIFNLYPKAVKKNDTAVVLGSVEFGDISAEEVVVDEVQTDTILKRSLFFKKMRIIKLQLNTGPDGIRIVELTEKLLQETIK